jgi:hypothetical protein
MVSGSIVFATTPVDNELALLDAVLCQVETHLDGSGATLFYGFVGDTGCADVVGLDWAIS